MSYDAPYKGLKVVDPGQGVAGPYAGMLMAQYGADVIKVEPLAGDWARSISTRYEDHSAFSVPANLGKRSIALDVKTQEGAACLQVVRMIANYLDNGEIKPGRYPAGMFPTADGWMNVLMFKESEWPPFCDMLDRADLATAPRFASNEARLKNVDALAPILEAETAKHDAAWLSERLTANGTMHEKVNDHLEFLGHPQVKATGLISWIEQPGIGRVPIPNAPGIEPLAQDTPLAMAPTVGQHTMEILRELGYDLDAIVALGEKGVTN